MHILLLSAENTYENCTDKTVSNHTIINNLCDYPYFKSVKGYLKTYKMLNKSIFPFIKKSKRVDVL